MKTQRWNLKPARSQIVHEFQKGNYTDEEKAWTLSEKPGTSGKDSVEWNALIKALVYVVFTLSDLNF